MSAFIRKADLTLLLLFLSVTVNECWRFSSASLWTSKLVSGLSLIEMSHCCACANAPSLFPLERLQCVMERCMWRSATWLMAIAHFLLWMWSVFFLWSWRERDESKGRNSKWGKRREWGNVCKREEGWFIPLEQSSPRQPPSHWQRSGATHRPWTHSLVQRAVGEKEQN